MIQVILDMLKNMIISTNLWTIIFPTLMVLILKKKYPAIKGYFGESRVKKRLAKLPNSYKSITDLLIKTSNGSCQIDHVVITPKGIFVVETKCFEGWIFGHEKDSTWTKVMYQNKTKFYNPIKQNFKHIQVLKEVVQEKINKKIPYISIVAFAGGAELKKINSTTPVIYEKDIYDTIINFNISQSLDTDTIENIYNYLMQINMSNNKAIVKEHIRSIKDRKRVI